MQPTEDLDIVYDANATGESKGQGLTVIGTHREPQQNGIISVTINNAGSGYAVGDIVSIAGGSGRTLSSTI